jgi:signal transduction histidine kinase
MIYQGFRRMKGRFMRPLLLIPVFFVVTWLTQMVIEDAQDQLTDQHYIAATTNLDVAYGQVVSGYERSAAIIYEHVINRDEVLAVFAGAMDADPRGQAIVRTQLYDLLIDDYLRLEDFNLRQLHFHLPDNTSFLRFHRPERYGDDLTGVRYTVMAANRDQVPVTGFEEGRIYNGFRYVRPLFYRGEHIGSVEVSVSFDAIHQELNHSLNGGTTFMLRADVVDAKVFEDQQSNYVVSDICPLWVYDRQVIANYADDDMPWATIQAINTELQACDLDRVRNGDSFSTYISADGESYLITFLAIANFSGEHVAYVIGYQPDSFISDSQMGFMISQSALGITGIIAMLAFWLIDRSTRFINRQRDQLAVQNAELEAANRLKSQFLANMSHELRTPMNAILNFSRFVSEGMVGPVNAKQVETLDMVTENGRHLLALINDLLDISKIEAGQLKLYIEDDIDLTREVRSAGEVARVMLDDKPVTLTLDLRDAPPPLRSDRRRVRQILLNLVSNACKFTTAGSITLTLWQDADDIYISVADTGPGIALDDQEMIFATFSQTTDGVKQGGGTGLGLPISRHLAHLLDGDLWVTSQPGAGTTFTVRLPRHSHRLDALKADQDRKFSV